MKATGIVRKLDKLDRIVIPKELCKTMDLQHDVPMEFFVDGRSIIIRKFENNCTFCSGSDSLTMFGGKQVCGKCREEMRKGLR